MNKKAYWIRHTHVLRKDEYECSSCGYYADGPYRVCPKCGAQMKGSKYKAEWVDEVEGFSAFLED